MRLALFRILGAFLAVMSSESASLAHHGFFLEFDSKAPITLSGTVRKLEWTNPHIFVHIDAKDGKTGKVASWECEGAAPNVLYRKGWRKDLFVAGSPIVVRGWKSRRAAHRCAISTIELSDGKVLESDYEAGTESSE